MAEDDFSLEPLINQSSVGEGVNKRLSDLYNFSDALEQAVKRIGNRDIISLGGKVLLAGEGVTSKILAGVQELFRPGGKSTIAILTNKLGQKLSAGEMNKLQKVLQKVALPTGVVDINNLVRFLSDISNPPDGQ